MDQYVFLDLGRLVQSAIDVTTASCKRFGADKAEITVSATRDAINADKNDVGIIEHVRLEAGVEVTASDIEFVKWLISADHAAKAVIEYLREAQNVQ
jgi:hypothetical protein